MIFEKYNIKKECSKIKQYMLVGASKEIEACKMSGEVLKK